MKDYVDLRFRKHGVYEKLEPTEGRKTMTLREVMEYTRNLDFTDVCLSILFEKIVSEIEKIQHELEKSKITGGGMRVKIFNNIDSDYLQNEMNQWLFENDEKISVFDIRFIFDDGGYAALIAYEEQSY